MLIEAASRLNVPVLSLDVGTSAPAKQISSADHVDGSFSDSSKIQELASKSDILTVEIEHVDATALQKIADDCKTSGGRSGKGIQIHPSPAVIRVIQDKYQQKLHLEKQGVPVADFLPIEGSSIESSISEAISKFGLPLMLKSRTQAYDGKGNYLLKEEKDVADAIKALGDGQRDLYAERFARFEAEIAVMVVKSATGEVKSYDPVETVHKDNICHLVKAPLRRGTRGTSDRARAFAEQAISALGDGAVGIFGVEMFLLPDGKLDLSSIVHGSLADPDGISNRHASGKRDSASST
jgi:phosphoribosylaminoimidazole carboxylase